jgi:outer membrane protein OmpA-like peptidoglycan-associated protein
MIMRSTLPILLLIAALTSGAGAQSIGIDPKTLRPGLQFRTNADAADKFRRLPYQNLPGEIRIELAADTLYDFDKDEIRSSAADYIQQTANLIFEEARGPVRIECRSDRLPTAVGQKLAARCANTIAQRLTVQETSRSSSRPSAPACRPPPPPPERTTPWRRNRNRARTPAPT